MNVLVVETPAEANAWREELGSVSADWTVVHISPDDFGIPHPYEKPRLGGVGISAIFRQLDRNSVRGIWVATGDTLGGEAVAEAVHDVIRESPFRSHKVHRTLPTRIALYALKKGKRDFQVGAAIKYKYRLVIDRMIQDCIARVMRERVGLELSLNVPEALALIALMDHETTINSVKRSKQWVVHTKLKNGMTAVSEPCHWEGMAQRYAKMLESAKPQVTKKSAKLDPPAPCNTTDLIVEAAKRWNLNSLQVMTAARRLYNSGLITNPYTEGHALEIDVQREVATYLKKDSLGYQKRTWQGDPAIQPTSIANKPKKDLGTPRKGIKTPADHVYAIIWERTVGSQMKPMSVERHRLSLKNPEGPGRQLGVAYGGKVLDAGYSQVLPVAKVTNMVPSTCNVLQVTIVPEYSDLPPRWREGDLIQFLAENGANTIERCLFVLERLWTHQYIRVHPDGTISPTVRGEFLVHTLRRNVPLFTQDFNDKIEKDLDRIGNDNVKGLAWVQNFQKKVLRRISDRLHNAEFIGERVICRRTQTDYAFKVHPEGDPYFINEKTGDMVGVGFNEEGLAIPWYSRKEPGFCKKCTMETLVTSRWWHGDKTVCTNCGAEA